MTYKPIFPDFSDNPFKDSRGRHMTQNLFFETTKVGHSTVLYTLKPYDHEFDGVTYPSLKKIYLELNDPTEWLIATQYFDGWAHWNKVLNDKRIREHVENWRKELEIQIRSNAIQQIIKDANSESKSAISSAKWLADRGWDKRKAGQPSKEEKKRIEKQIGEEITEFDDDYQRILEIK